MLATLRAIASVVEFIRLIWEWLKKSKVDGAKDEISKLAEKRKDLLEQMEKARVKRDFVLYERLFDEYSQLQSPANS